MNRFSFNQITAKHWALTDLVKGCVDAGVDKVALWREPVAEYGLARSAALVRDVGLTVTTLCRSGFFQLDGWFDDNRRAIDETAALGAPVLVLVSGGLPEGSKDIAGARAHVADAIAQLVPHAAAAGVTLAIEPLHPMYAADRCVINTWDQAMSIAEQHPVGQVGVTVDTYHLWWDDTVLPKIEAAGDRIAIYQLADWITPLPAGVLTGRGLPGDGCIDMRAFHDAVAKAGYTGPIEVEVMNEELWQRPGPDILAATIAGYRSI
ncbi:sugar phosphate isomerase/epimerase [Actinoplanes campanulatus]|uniref:Sugar phosphate isomerase/epimerase n=1 Tax=Actinoplanes campanulatus TaxID=113559 RepID=A0A7W5FH94_9ACTN|nr:sugar phosphate isomerase/epimerase family protein [Actinoplanes campanulatus]MBB3098247.1 sugar phosphate isomerase/epimerase [Actinoplanes campanulatus]GGN34757.1 xylose isomerase [Actinoplanes campanulatus]GID38794.1 xylose isomerase [Actinoplanes campanulatus]